MASNILSKTELDVCQALFGPPPVLSTENAENFQQILDRSLTCLESRDLIEVVLIRDFVVAAWEDNRYARHRAVAVERWHAQSLDAMAQQAKLQQARKEQFVRSKASDMGRQPADIGHLVELEGKVLDPIHSVRDILDRQPTERDHNRALEKGIAFLEQLDRLSNSATARRGGALRELDLYRRGLGALVSAVVDKVIDAACQELTAPSDQTSSLSLVPSESETDR
jgi:sulfur transfer complex TusBCD TusB component (DsrH family)